MDHSNWIKVLNRVPGQSLLWGNIHDILMFHYLFLRKMQILQYFIGVQVDSRFTAQTCREISPKSGGGHPCMKSVGDISRPSAPPPFDRPLSELNLPVQLTFTLQFSDQSFPGQSNPV